MSKNFYVGIGGKAREGQELYVGVNGVARKVKSGYVGVNGVARKFWPGVFSWGRYTILNRYSWDMYDTRNQETSQDILYGNPIYLGAPYYKIDRGRPTYVEGKGYYLTTVISSNPSTVYHGDSYAPFQYSSYYYYQTSGNSTVNVFGRVELGTDDSVTRIEMTKVKGDNLQGNVYSTDINKYPNGGIAGNYWYENRTLYEQVRGTYIDTVESESENAYPSNGIQDGYWYVAM